MRSIHSLLTLAFPFDLLSRSESADARSTAIGSFGGVSENVRFIVSRQNWSRIMPIVGVDVVSGIMDRETFRARRAR